MSGIYKKKKISKRNKSAWRKTDIKDVENYLEEKRQEERIGTISAKKDEELFVVDATPNEPKKTGLTIKEKRKLNAKKPLRSLQALKNTSLVPDPIVKRNHVKQKKSGRIIEEEIRNPSKARHFQANKDRERYYEQLDKKIKKTGNSNHKFDKDIWVVEDFRDKIPGLKDEKGWISDDLALYVAKSMGKVSVKVHDGIRHRTTKAKNFQPPHPGISYNPSSEDYNALLQDVVDREEKIIKEEEHLKRVTTKMFSKVTPEERDLCRLKEMASGLENDVDEIIETSAPYEPVNPPVENNKKSKQKRRKALLQKELQKRNEAKKALKKQIADINRIKSIKAEVLNEANTLNELRKRRKKTTLKKKFEPKRLARLKYKEPDADVNMPDDIDGNLRNIKTESSLLVDRFKNFQKRNILPPSVSTGKQKARKIKRFPRSSHKEPGVSFEKLRQMKKRNEL